MERTSRRCTARNKECFFEKIYNFKEHTRKNQNINFYIFLKNETQIYIYF